MTNLSIKDEEDVNITKVKINWITKNNLGEANDFYKKPKKKITDIYHHLGIYSFRYESLKKFLHIKPMVSFILKATFIF